MNENTDFAAKEGADYFKVLKEHLESLTRSIEDNLVRYEEAVVNKNYMTAANVLAYARDDYRRIEFELKADSALMALYMIASIQSVTGHLEGSKK